jgi:uncharacterized protein (DUF927 family)
MKSTVTSCSYATGRFQVSDKGVHYHGKDKDGNELPALWICSSMRVTAKTRDEKSGEWGRLLEWQDDDGNSHQWPMPLELLESDGLEVRRELARLGLHISPNATARGLLTAYIKCWPVDARVCCVNRLGWHGGVYVTPSESIGSSEDRFVFQNAHSSEPGVSVAGSEQDWRNNVAALAQGNSRLVFALSVAFAGSLLDIATEDSGGFHLRGASSSGKSTALKVAASVWGSPPRYVRLWRGTTNGLEGLAALHNDGLLILDEIGQIDPAAAGDAAYLLANGQGKARATRHGLAREPQRWRLLFLSAGEESLSAIMERAGKKTSAGQEIRLADIEADAGANMGLFENLHEFADPAAFAAAIKDATSNYYGAVGMQWLRLLVENRATLPEVFKAQIEKFVIDVVPMNAAGQVARVASRFALVAVAGELATRFGLTGWPEGEAIKSARTCFEAWFAGFGGMGNLEERAIVSQVCGFIEMHGGSRFEDINATNDQRIPNRVGFHRNGDNGHHEFLILVEPFKKEVCRGLDRKLAIATLLLAKILTPAKDGKPTHVIRLPGLGTSRVYVLRYQVANDEVSGTDSGK